MERATVKKKSAVILVGIGIVFTMFVPVLTWAEDELDPTSAAEKARKSHELAGSDMIYQQEDFKALYYQNMQVIQLLKEIRDSLEVIKARGGMKNPEEKAS